ncbi:hypothetical protein F0562_022983 [Nyssa sinensis]|uniref:Uncharacterized protein n=1 Tax=Nyssa sinensis TaxID=561372 RepID=A0A5J5BL01_9ASTE|nr:hypothetical protein F0562_022983 [Nyssa sinensis]
MVFLTAALGHQSESDLQERFKAMERKFVKAGVLVVMVVLLVMFAGHSEATSECYNYCIEGCAFTRVPPQACVQSCLKQCPHTSSDEEYYAATDTERKP